VRDAVTDKRLVRQLALASLPDDARPLAIAVATDELLRASWLEIALASAPPQRQVAPAAVTDIVAADLSHAPRAEMGAWFAFESYSGGQVAVGGDLRGGVRALPRLTVTLRIGLRQGSQVTAPDGRIRSSAVLVGTGLKLALTQPRARAGLEAIGRVDAARVSFLADANPNAFGTPSQGTAIVAGGGLSAWVALGPSVVLQAEATMGGALRPVRVTDMGSEVTAIAGLALAAGGGIAAVF